VHRGAAQPALLDREQPQARDVVAETTGEGREQRLGERAERGGLRRSMPCPTP